MFITLRFFSNKVQLYSTGNYIQCTAAAAKSLQSCPTPCNPIDGCPLGSPVPGILQARTLEWVAISFSNAWKGKVKVKSLSRDRLLATPWSAADRAPPSMGFSRQEYWSGLPLPSPIQCTRINYNGKNIKECVYIYMYTHTHTHTHTHIYTTESAEINTTS